MFDLIDKVPDLEEKHKYLLRLRNIVLNNHHLNKEKPPVIIEPFSISKLFNKAPTSSLITTDITINDLQREINTLKAEIQNLYSEINPF